ncbi:RDD family protein [Micromonospora profundi]|uniref:RDD family protein n=1 Tax=Micromonospora profundi TaxID=1420889 RepID=UPI00339DFD7C
MTQPPTYPTPLAGGPPPAAGGFAPQPGQIPHGYAVPPQYAPPGYPQPQWPVAPPALSPAGQPLASFGDRLIAWIIDTALASVVAMVLFMPAFLALWWWMFTEMTQLDPDGTLVEPTPVTFLTGFFLPVLLLQFTLVVVLLGIYWLYHVEYLKRGGQTLGKKIMKLRVVPLDPNGTLDRRMAGRRWLVQYLAATLIPGVSYADGFWQLWDKPWQQCLHDKFAGTVVVKVAS